MRLREPIQRHDLRQNRGRNKRRKIVRENATGRKSYVKQSSCNDTTRTDLIKTAAPSKPFKGHLQRSKETVCTRYGKGPPHGRFTVLFQKPNTTSVVKGNIFRECTEAKAAIHSTS